MKHIVLVGILLLAALSLHAKKIKLTLAPAYLVNNELINETAMGYGGGINLGYEVLQGHLFNVELSIANHFHHFPLASEVMNIFRVGFGIRVIVPLEGVRPYFTHDIQSAYIWRSSQDYPANAVSVLLGLGLEIPMHNKSSLLVEVDHQFMGVGYFDVAEQKLSFVTLTLGWMYKI